MTKVKNYTGWLMEQEPAAQEPAAQDAQQEPATSQAKGTGEASKEIDPEMKDLKVFAKPDPDKTMEVTIQAHPKAPKKNYLRLSIPFVVGINLRHRDFVNLLEKEPEPSPILTASGRPHSSAAGKDLYRKAVLDAFDSLNSTILQKISAQVANFNKVAEQHAVRLEKEEQQYNELSKANVVFTSAHLEKLLKEFTSLNKGTVKRYHEQFGTSKNRQLLKDISSLVATGKDTYQNTQVTVPNPSDISINPETFIIALMVIFTTPQLDHIADAVSNRLKAISSGGETSGEGKAPETGNTPESGNTFASLIMELLDDVKGKNIGQWASEVGGNQSGAYELAKKGDNKIPQQWGDAAFIGSLLKDADVLGLGKIKKSWGQALTANNAKFLRDGGSLPVLEFPKAEAPAEHRKEMEAAIDKYIGVWDQTKPITEPIKGPGVSGELVVKMDQTYANTSEADLGMLYRSQTLADIGHSIRQGIRDIFGGGTSEDIMRQENKAITEEAVSTLRHTSMKHETFETHVKKYFEFLLESLDGIIIRPHAGGEDQESLAAIESIANDMKSGVPLLNAKSGALVIKPAPSEEKPDWGALRNVANSIEMKDGMLFTIFKKFENSRVPEVYMVYRDEQGYHLRGLYRIGQNYKLGDVKNILGTSPYASYTELFDNFENTYMFAGAVAFLPFTLKALNPDLTQKALAR